MRMQVQRVLLSGNATLDAGVTGMVALSDGDQMRLFVSTGRNGGLSSYRLDGNGNMAVQSQRIFPDSITGTVSDDLILETVNGTSRLYVGASGQGLISYGVRENLTLDGRQVTGWRNAEELAAENGNRATLEALVTMAERPGNLLQLGTNVDQIVSLQGATVDGRHFVLLADAHANAVTVMSHNETAGRMIPIDSYGAGQGLGINAPTAMDVISLAGTTYVVLASAGSSSLSVMRLGADGRMRPVDHVIDTAATHIGRVQAMATVQQGDHAFVVAGGGDHGVSLFRLLPDGRLVFLHSVANSDDLPMHNVSAIAAAIHGGVLHVYVGSQRDSGVTHLTVGMNDPGAVRYGSRNRADEVAGTNGADVLYARHTGDTLSGGAGDDVLISGPGRTTMRGGSGSDTFVIRENSSRVDILDFRAGHDRLDLSALPMLRDIAQLNFASTGNGATIRYRDVTISLRSNDGNRLTLEDVFPDELLGVHRIPILQRANVSLTGEEIIGGPGDDLLTGTERDDTIWGLRGDDLIELIGGNDLVYAGPGDDTIIGASRGNATIYGGEGDDVIYAIGGNNWVGGGPGNDTIHGGSGNDLLWGGEGNDLIHTGAGRNEAWGGEGNNTIHGGDGGNLMGPGPGNGRVYGGAGNDTIWGGRGNDLIRTGGGHNEAWGGRGDDTIHGGAGNNTLGGGEGDDLIFGGSGNDTIYGGPGDDTLHGGAGADTFVFYRNQDTNRIMDFDASEGDTLLLARWLWGPRGDLDAAEVVSAFASVNRNGDTVLNFGSHGGTIIVLVGFDDLEALATQIEII